MVQIPVIIFAKLSYHNSMFSRIKSTARKADIPAKCALTTNYAMIAVLVWLGHITAKSIRTIARHGMLFIKLSRNVNCSNRLTRFHLTHIPQLHHRPGRTLNSQL